LAKLLQGILKVYELLVISSLINTSSARELDNKVADELEAMEQNAVLTKHWNGPSELEHLNTQHRAWSHVKQKDRDNKLAHHD
jgi:hypothetical protein